MGMFDSVWFKCPNCGEEIEEQTKIGDCILANYNEDKVPVEIAHYLLHSELKCYHCDEFFKIVPNEDIRRYVKIKLVKEE